MKYTLKMLRASKTGLNLRHLKQLAYLLILGKLGAQTLLS